MRPKIPWLEEPTRFLEFVDRVLPDFLASPHRALKPKATWWRLLSKEPSNWAALDRALALLFEQQFLALLAGDSPKSILEPEDVDIVADLERREKKKAKKKKAKKKKTTADAEKAELDGDLDESEGAKPADESLQSERGEVAAVTDDVASAEVAEADPQEVSNLSTPRTSSVGRARTPSVTSVKSEKTAPTESGAPSEEGQSLEFSSTAGTRRSPPTDPAMTPEDAPANVSPHCFVSMIWSGLSQEAMDGDDSGDQGEWAQVTARKNRKSRKHVAAKGDGERLCDAEPNTAHEAEAESPAALPAGAESDDPATSVEAFEQVSTIVTGTQQAGASWVPYEDEVEYTNVPPACPLTDPLDADPPPEVKMPDGGCPWATLLRDAECFDLPTYQHVDDDVEYPDTDEEVMYGWY